MQSYAFLEQIEEKFYRRVVFCLQKVFNQDLTHYFEEFRMRKTSAVPNFIWDSFWDNLETHLEIEGIRVEEFSRNGWSGDMIIDDSHKFVLTVMRENRLIQLKKSKKRSLHYLETFVGVLNRDFEAPGHQMLFSEFGLYDENDLAEDFEKLLKGRIRVDDGYHHCLLVFRTLRNQLLDVSLCVLDRHLEICREITLNEFINPDYSTILSNKQEIPNKIKAQDDIKVPTPYKKEAEVPLVRLKNL